MATPRATQGELIDVRPLGDALRDSKSITLMRSDHLEVARLVMRNENMSRELLEFGVRLYAERLRHNMAVEELTMFPIATHHLDSDDWSSILQSHPQRSADPLFQSPVHERFVQLHRVIAAEADCGCKEGDA